MNRLREKLTLWILLASFTSATLAATITFEDFTSEAGLITPLIGNMGHCAIWGYFNDDEYPDLFYGNFSDRGWNTYNTRGHTTGPIPDKLFINNGGHTFTELPSFTAFNLLGRCSGGAFADFDNDGDFDLIVTHNSLVYETPSHDSAICQESNHLFRNNGNGTLSDVTTGSNVHFAAPMAARSALVLDYDGDGLLDILIEEDTVMAQIPGGSKGISRLMRNRGNFVFENVTTAAGLPAKGLHGLGGCVGDINGDSWPDLFLSHSCRLFINQKNGTFTEKTYSILRHGDWPCGADLGDLDNDGDIDLVIGEHYIGTSAGDDRIRIFLNKGNDVSGFPIFEDVSSTAGVVDVGSRQPDIDIVDFDNDGRMDISTGSCAAFVYANTGVISGIPRFARPVTSGYAGGAGYWPGVATADFDRDGKIDAMTSEWLSEVYAPLLHNTTQTANNWIDVRINQASTSKNRHGIGAIIKIYNSGQAGVSSALLGSSVIAVSNGYSSGTVPLVHFGVPGQSAVDIVVQLPCGGGTLTQQSVSVNGMVVITGSKTVTTTYQRTEINHFKPLQNSSTYYSLNGKKMTDGTTRLERSRPRIVIRQTMKQGYLVCTTEMLVR